MKQVSRHRRSSGRLGEQESGEVLDSIEDRLKVHMYWLNVQGFRVKGFVVCCLFFGTFVSEYSRYNNDITIILQPKLRHYRVFF